MEHELSNLLNESTKEKIQAFVEFHRGKNSNVVLITSGGTTVPLEEKTVRFIDNFSVGTRGSSSAEYFLKHGYAVIFLYRKRSLKPFERKFNNMNILDLIKPENDSGEFTVDQSFLNFDFKQTVDEYNRAREDNLLLSVDFISVFDYFALLEFISKQMSVFRNKGVVYLAAAVSDFYMPKHEMPTHKIQSDSNNQGLVLDLKPVPKLIGKLRHDWCPEAFVVTFKLETDPSILFAKMRKALDSYQHQAVVGNILESRARHVVVMQQHGQSDDIDLDKFKKDTGRENVEIEELLVEFLVKLHSSIQSR
jgi:phosphopantothenate-cysteine ligase